MTMLNAAVETLLTTVLVNGVTPMSREAIKIVKPEMIENRIYKKVFETVVAIDNFNATVNLNSVYDNLADQIPFEDFVEITKNVMPSREPIREAMQIVTHYNDSKSLRSLQEIAHRLSSGKIFDRVEMSKQLSEISDLIHAESKSEPVHINQYVDSYIEMLEERQENPGGQFLDIGLDLLVDKTALIVMGAQPGMGKTALMLYIIDYIASRGKKSLSFSLEMQNSQLVERMVSSKSSIPIRDLKNIGVMDLGDESWGRIGMSLNEMENKPIYLDDEPRLTIHTLKKKARDFKEKHPDLALITVDYLGLMEAPNAQTQALAIGEITRTMKLLAKELKTPILVLSQLNRESAKAKREPQNSDLRDSGSIEQDADIIIFPYREEEHFPDSPNRGLAKIIKGKVRDDEKKDTILTFKNGAFGPYGGGWIEKQEEPKPERRKF